jgi:tetratricopeptide (TPR) repeat protein
MSGTETNEAPTRRRLVPLPVIGIVATLGILALGIGVYFAFFNDGPGSDSTQAKANAAAAQAAFDSADYDRAADIYADLADADPKDLDLRRRLAETLAADGKSEEAIAQYQAIVEKAPQDAGALYAMATLEQLIGKTAEAITHYEAAVAITPDPQYLQALAPVYSQVGKWAESVATWERYLQVATLAEPGQAQVYAAIATAYENAREYDKAEEALEQALFLDPNNETYKARLEAYED